LATLCSTGLLSERHCLDAPSAVRGVNRNREGAVSRSSAASSNMSLAQIDLSNAEVSARKLWRLGFDDASLVGMLVEQNPEAQRTIWNQLSPMVRRMCTRAIPDGQVDDLVQDIFHIFFRQVHLLREPRALKAFIITITKHEIARAARRRKASAQVFCHSDRPAGIARPADLDARKALEHLCIILARLNDVDRTAFALRFIERLALSEISQALGVSEATTKRRIARAWSRVTVHARQNTALGEYAVRWSTRRSRR
jgi:RNA polymerase sigma-70 factor (ECF subfamily)